RALSEPDVGDFEVGFAGPGFARDRADDLDAVGGELVEADLAGVALGDRVGGDEAELAGRAGQAGGAQEKIRAEVGAAAAAGGEVFDQEITVVGAEGAGDLLAALERRV